MIASQPTRVRTVLLYAQDNKGLGHVTRTLTVARHILERHPHCVAYIATKSPLSGFTLPERCDYIKLPNLLTPPPGTSRWTMDQEKAAKLGVKLVFPIFFCILPSLFVVTVGPVAMKIVRELLPMMNNM